MLSENGHLSLIFDRIVHFNWTIVHCMESIGLFGYGERFNVHASCLFASCLYASCYVQLECMWCRSTFEKYSIQLAVRIEISVSRTNSLARLWMSNGRLAQYIKYFILFFYFHTFSTVLFKIIERTHTQIRKALDENERVHLHQIIIHLIKSERAIVCTWRVHVVQSFQFSCCFALLSVALHGNNTKSIRIWDVKAFANDNYHMNSNSNSNNDTSTTKRTFSRKQFCDSNYYTNKISKSKPRALHEKSINTIVFTLRLCSPFLCLL